MIFTHHKYYIGSISSNDFYYKDAIFAYYQMYSLGSILPIEIIDKIMSFICSSLTVFAANNTIYYINPRDNAIIKTVPSTLTYNHNKYYKFIYAVSDDGLTIYRIRTCVDWYDTFSDIQFEYICEEQTDPNQPIDVDTTTNRYVYNYNYLNELTPSLINNFSNLFSLSKNGKYIATVINREGPCIAIYVAKTKELIAEFSVENSNTHKLSAQCLNFSPDNNMIMASYKLNSMYITCLWNINTRELLMKHNSNAYLIPNNHILWNPSSTKFSLLFHDDDESRVVFGNVTNNTCTILEDCIYLNEWITMDYIVWISDNKFAYYGYSNIYIMDSIGEVISYFPTSYKNMPTINASYDGHLIVRYKPVLSETNDQSTSDKVSTFDINEPDVWFDIWVM